MTSIHQCLQQLCSWIGIVFHLYGQANTSVISYSPWDALPCKEGCTDQGTELLRNFTAFLFLLLNFSYGKQRTGKTSEVFYHGKKSKKEVVVVWPWESASCGTRESDLCTDVQHAQLCFTLLTSTSLTRYCIIRCTPDVMY